MIDLIKTPPREAEENAVNILSKEITAYFQPIAAADTGKIYAYEALGRYIDNDGVKSLGAFYSSASNEEALEVDRIVRRAALKRFSEEANGEYLFLNMRLSWMKLYADNPHEMLTIKWAKEFGIDLSKLVIEITEEEFRDDNESFAKVLAQYKSVGCRIAIDDFGSAASHIDRLALLSPDILKIDMRYIHRSVDSLHYREYLKALTFFAEKVGINVLYEGIETEKQLDICVSSKGRFYQGFLIAKPQPSIRAAAANHEVLLTSIGRYIKSLRENSVDINNLHEIWDAKIEEFLLKYGAGFSAEEMNGYVSKIGLWLAAFIKRIYICDRQGNQMSYNIEVEDGKIEMRDYRNKNWAWRSFFQEAAITLDKGAKSYMTNSYRDVTTKEKIQTYIYRIRFDMYLFIDITK